MQSKQSYHEETAVLRIQFRILFINKQKKVRKTLFSTIIFFTSFCLIFEDWCKCTLTSNGQTNLWKNLNFCFHLVSHWQKSRNRICIKMSKIHNTRRKAGMSTKIWTYVGRQLKRCIVESLQTVLCLLAGLPVHQAHRVPHHSHTVHYSCHATRKYQRKSHQSESGTNKATRRGKNGKIPVRDKNFTKLLQLLLVHQWNCSWHFEV